MSNAFSIATQQMNQLVSMANANYTTLVDIVNEVIGDGSPKGVFDTLLELQQEYPKGAKGIYLVNADGNWYYWDGEWVSGGVYQATQLSDGSVTEEKLVPDLKGKIDQIPTISDQVNEQNQRIDRIVAQAGDDNTEIVDARGDYNVLGARLNATDSQITETTKQGLMQNGDVRFPTGISIPFALSRVAKRRYRHNATPFNQHDWTGAVEVFISASGQPAVSGTDYLKPIRFDHFRAKYLNGDYGSNKIILTVLDSLYVYNNRLDLTGVSADIYIRSGSVAGQTWIGRVKRAGVSGETSAWVSESGVYKTTQSTNHPVLDMVNTRVVDGFGMPKVYVQVTSLAACISTPGSFFQNAADVYCNPIPGSIIGDVMLLVSTVLIATTGFTGNVLMIEGINFLAQSYTFSLPAITTTMYLFRCKFYRGLQDAMGVTGAYNIYLFDCTAAYASKDGFNYHTTDSNSRAVEINCTSYGNGQYKMSGGNTTRHSNNGSTAHDGMTIIRAGGRYWDNEGPTVADADNCYVINIGCEAGTILPTTTGVRAGYYVYDGGSTPPKPKYMIDCETNGNNVDQGINGTAQTYYMDFESLGLIIGGAEPVIWEDVAV